MLAVIAKEVKVSWVSPDSQDSIDSGSTPNLFCYIGSKVFVAGRLEVFYKIGRLFGIGDVA